MVQGFDHRAASVVVNPENLNRPAQAQDASLSEHANPTWLPEHQYWVPESECGWAPGTNWVLGFKEITAPTNVRTFIAALFPAVGFGNKVPILKPETEDRKEWLLAANLNAMVFDFATRQKVQGQTLNLFILEQLPVIATDDYDQRCGDKTARDLVRDHVLRLTYTAQDMAPFAVTSAMTARRSPGTRRSAAICGRGSTPSISISTGYPERTRATGLTPAL